MSKVLRSIFGDDNVPEPISCLVTRWSRDPFALGSYTYVKVGGDPSDITELSEPIGDGRVRFAGEATSPHYLASCHGAYLSGIREARRLLDKLLWHESGLLHIDPADSVENSDLHDAP